MAKLFDVSERFHVPIDQIAHPSDRSIFGSHFGEQSYYADFAGIARKQAPHSILEIGVRYGYSGLAMCLGARAAGVETVRYVGMDAEFFSGPEPGDYQSGRRSNTIAKENFKKHAPWVQSTFYSVDTQKSPIPEAVLEERFDLINVDGDHSYEGCLKDMRSVWPLLNKYGLMIVDDTGMEGVRGAIETFIAELHSEIEHQWCSNERGFCILMKR